LGGTILLNCQPIFRRFPSFRLSRFHVKRVNLCGERCPPHPRRATSARASLGCDGSKLRNGDRPLIGYVSQAPADRDAAGGRRDN
jgi:hypothetical protein